MGKLGPTQISAAALFSYIKIKVTNALKRDILTKRFQFCTEIFAEAYAPLFECIYHYIIIICLGQEKTARQTYFRS